MEKKRHKPRPCKDEKTLLINRLALGVAMNQVAVAVRLGSVELPLHLRGTSWLPHKARVEILGECPGKPSKFKIRHGSREYDVEKVFVKEI
jgi:hypothetical protein